MCARRSYKKGKRTYKAGGEIRIFGPRTSSWDMARWPRLLLACTTAHGRGHGPVCRQLYLSAHRSFCCSVAWLLGHCPSVFGASISLPGAGTPLSASLTSRSAESNEVATSMELRCRVSLVLSRSRASKRARNRERHNVCAYVGAVQ